MVQLPARTGRFLRRALPVAMVAAALGVSSIDEYAGYDGQVDCAQRLPGGTSYLAGYLPRRWGGSVVSTLRACTDGVSEHKDGRAIDWSADASSATDRARVERFLADVFATDAAGEAHALARRLGIMYLIWDDEIYSAYSGFAPRPYLSSGCESVRRCSATLRHRDHVHLSLSRAGAQAQTSFYRQRGVPRTPVLLPGTRVLDATSTAIWSTTVPADGSTVRTPFELAAGTTYQLVADGRVRYGPGAAVTDAACAWSSVAGAGAGPGAGPGPGPGADPGPGAGPGWVPDDVGLRVAGRLPWRRDAEAVCAATGTAGAAAAARVTEVTPTRTQRLAFSAGDATASDNSGAFTVSIVRPDVSLREVVARVSAARPAPRPARAPGAAGPRLRAETVTVSAARAGGVRTRGALQPARRYRVVVTGTARTGETRFDGSCVAYAGRLRAQHSLDLAQPDADHLGLFVQGVPLDLHVAGSSRECSGQHRYAGTYRPPVKGRARVKIHDPLDYADNAGALTVKFISKG